MGLSFFSIEAVPIKWVYSEHFKPWLDSIDVHWSQRLLCTSTVSSRVRVNYIPSSGLHQTIKSRIFITSNIPTYIINFSGIVFSLHFTDTKTYFPMSQSHLYLQNIYVTCYLYLCCFSLNRIFILTLFTVLIVYLILILL